MDKLPMPEAGEPAVPSAPAAGVARIVGCALLALLVLAGAWVRFNDRIAAVSPTLAGPARLVAEERSATGRVKALVELAMLPAAAGPDAVATGLGPAEAALLAEAVRRGRVRLVRLPLFDARAMDPGAADQGSGGPGVAGTEVAAGRSVEVSSGGYTRVVSLGRAPVMVTLPIDRAGTVSFRAGPGGAGIGAVTLSGPVVLPRLAAGQAFSVGVVAQ